MNWQTKNSPDGFKGILFMLAFCMVVTTSAILIKKLGQSLNSFEVVMIRCAFTVLITLIFNYRLGKILISTHRPNMVAGRSALTCLVVVCNFYAVSSLPLVEVTSLQFSKPLFLIILAAIFLGERIRIYRTTATILGFIGIMIVLHPWNNESGGSLEWAHLSVLAAALGMAVLAVFSKILSKDHIPVTLVLYANTATVLIVSLTKLKTPSTKDSPMDSKSLVNRVRVTPVGVLSKYVLGNFKMRLNSSERISKTVNCPVLRRK